MWRIEYKQIKQNLKTIGKTRRLNATATSRCEPFRNMDALSGGSFLRRIKPNSEYLRKLSIAEGTILNIRKICCINTPLWMPA